LRKASGRRRGNAAVADAHLESSRRGVRIETLNQKSGAWHKRLYNRFIKSTELLPVHSERSEESRTQNADQAG
jgi:hypothetical protein